MKKFTLISFSFLFLFALGATQNIFAQNAVSEVRTGIATLYAQDPLAQTFCFRDGNYGKVIQENEVRNRCSDIDFNSYVKNSFSVGIEGARQGKIIDLGTDDELQAKYKYSETVGKGQGFASIQLHNGKIHILKERRPLELQELVEANDLFQTRTSDNTDVKPGNIYILRLTDRLDKSFERIVKLLVTDYQPDRFVTIRWQIILDSEEIKER